MNKVKSGATNSKKKTSSPAPDVPDFGKVLKGALRSEEELQYGLRGVVRILSNRGRKGRNGYFFEGFQVLFASELKEQVLSEEVFLDYENLKIIIKLPDPKDSKNKELIRHEYTRQYALGADDLKTRAALVAFSGLDDATKEALVENEKKFEPKRKK